MDGAKDATVTSGPVIYPSLWAMLTELPPRGLCIGNAIKHPFAKSLEHSNETGPLYHIDGTTTRPEGLCIGGFAFVKHLSVLSPRALRVSAK